MKPSETAEKPDLRPGHLAPYQRTDLKRSLWQIANSVLPYLALWVLMVLSLGHSYWITLGLAALAAGFLVRVFIIFHDCGHGSFFGSRRTNDVVGFLTGVLTLTPHRQWWRQHMLHHASNGDLNRRGDGDVWTLTVEEYRAAPLRQRIAYRLVRNPLFMLTVGPLVLFGVLYRFPTRNSRRPERLSVVWTNLAIAAIGGAMMLAIGPWNYLKIHLPVLIFSGAAGIWLFYVQHQFEDVQWQRAGRWDFVAAALRGSSYYRLPRLLQWFSGNIGFHHVHHLNPLVPNYFLENCHRDRPDLRRVPELNLRTSLRCLSLRLWDENRQRLVGFADVENPAPSAGVAAD